MTPPLTNRERFAVFFDVLGFLLFMSCLVALVASVALFLTGQLWLAWAVGLLVIGIFAYRSLR